MTSTILATLIFLCKLVLVIWQPRGLSIGWSATVGAALALITYCAGDGPGPGVQGSHGSHFVMGSVLIADTASSPLIISNRG